MPEPDRSTAIAALRETSALLYQRGWAFGTSGNYSVVLQREPLRLLITASGRDKRSLSEDDFVIVDADARPIETSTARPSAETALHTTLAAEDGVGAVLHTHSIWNTVLSDAHAADGELAINGFEMLKGLSGIDTHDTTARIPIFENSQDIPSLATRVRTRLRAERDASRPGPHAFLLRGHGLYTWGRDLADARRHVEILEFLFEVCGRRRMLRPAV